MNNNLYNYRTMRKFYFVLAAIMFVACSKNDPGLYSQPEPQNPYAVTPEEAVQMLQSVIGGETTRSISVSDIQTLSKSAFVPSTRSGADEEAIYIVDIEGKGSAIVSADKRMEPIYAILDDTKISAEQLVGVTTRSATDDESDIEDFVFSLLGDAIVNDIQEVEQRGIEMPLIPRDQTWTETTITARQTTMLNTKWAQEEPYNMKCPRKISTNPSYAGCGPIAAAQIMYYNRFPDYITYQREDNTFAADWIDWNLIEGCEYGYPLLYDCMEELNELIYHIGVRMGVDYHLDDTNAIDPVTGEYKAPPTTNTPEQAETFFENIGYSDVSLVNYSLMQVINMVSNKHLPVYMSGHYYNTNNPAQPLGHAWVIDGCDVYTVDYWVRHYIDGSIYTEYIENTQNFNLVHCNYGWSGKCDGYYTSGIFDTRTPLPANRIDSAKGDIQHAGKENYDLLLQLITYSLN